MDRVLIPSSHILMQEVLSLKQICFNDRHHIHAIANQISFQQRSIFQIQGNFRMDCPVQAPTHRALAVPALTATVSAAKTPT